MSSETKSGTKSGAPPAPALPASPQKKPSAETMHELSFTQLQALVYGPQQGSAPHEIPATPLDQVALDTAKYYLAWYYLAGFNQCPIDATKALNLLKPGTNCHPQASAVYADTLYSFGGQSKKASLAVFKRGAAQGDPFSVLFWTRVGCYADKKQPSGMAEDKEATKAFSFITKMAQETGRHDAELFAAFARGCGVGTQVDWKVAKQAFRKLAQKGHALAQNALAVQLLEEDTTSNAAEAYKLLFASTSQGYLPAHVHAAWLVEQGLGVQANPKAALTVLTHAAELGCSRSMSSLCRLHFEGIGTRMDHQKAYQYGKRAIEAGCYLEAHFLALLVSKGWGCVQNETYASTILQEGSKQKNPFCCLELGVRLLEDNKPEDARVILTLAVDYGSAEACAYLCQIEDGQQTTDQQTKDQQADEKKSAEKKVNAKSPEKKADEKKSGDKTADEQKTHPSTDQKTSASWIATGIQLCRKQMQRLCMFALALAKLDLFKPAIDVFTEALKHATSDTNRIAIWCDIAGCYNRLDDKRCIEFLELAKKAGSTDAADDLAHLHLNRRFGLGELPHAPSS